MTYAKIKAKTCNSTKIGQNICNFGICVLF